MIHDLSFIAKLNIDKSASNNSSALATIESDTIPIGREAKGEFSNFTEITFSDPSSNFMVYRVESNDTTYWPVSPHWLT